MSDMSKIKTAIAIAFPIILLGLYSFFTFFPLAWSIMASFKTTGQLIRREPLFIFAPTLENYRALFAYGEKFIEYMINSIIVNVVAVGVSLAVGLPMAYSLARFRLKYQDGWAVFILTMRMFPPIVILIPFYILYQSLGLMDTLFGLVIFYQIFNLPLIVWLLRGYFRDVPREIEEAGMMDGASRITAFRRHVMPLVLSATIATCLIAFSMTWNDFLVSTILTTVHTKTAPAYLGQMRGYTGVLWSQLAAAGLLMTVPVVILALIFRKYLVRVLSFGAVRR